MDMCEKITLEILPFAPAPMLKMYFLAKQWVQKMRFLILIYRVSQQKMFLSTKGNYLLRNIFSETHGMSKPMVKFLG